MSNTINLVDELSQNFIDFSHEANCQRAFADARDGLKPGQRACLWEMYVKGYSSNKPHVKSAKISGGTIATWHPHGDTAIYNTFARMSQSWVNNIPEVDWHGANGSIQISGEPAASRYTEARLSKATEEGLLTNIKKHNVPMKLNFSEDEEWPEVFPALMPRLMVNGCQGIGSTIANVWLPYSLNELAEVIIKYVQTGELDYTNLAPSFPTGGVIINKKDIPTIHKTGKGKVILRGRAEIQGNNILITEIPYQTYVEPLIEEIKKLAISEEIPNINNVLNKSDKKRLLIEVECENNPAGVLKLLYKNTSLQKTFSANQYALVNKVPKLLNLKEYLDIYLNHNYECICREYIYDLRKAQDRIEIVKGLIKALEDIDNIIAIIKKSENTSSAMQNLISTYFFTERQAKAIIDMRLGKLAHLEKIALNQEKEDLTSIIKNCQDIIDHLDRRKEIYLDRFVAFVSKYGRDRTTELTQIEIKPEEKEIAEVVPEDVVVVATKSGLVKRVPLSSFKVQRKGGKGVKSQDDILLDVIKTNTVDTLILFTSSGKMYRTIVDNVPNGTNISKGTPFNDLIKLSPGEEVINMTSLHRKSTPKYVIFITKNGLVKKTYLEEYFKTNRNSGIAALKIKEGDSIAEILFQDEEDMLIITKEGMSIKFSTKDITPVGRVAAGVRGIKLNEKDEVISALPIHKETDNVAIFTSSGLAKKVKLKDFPFQVRGGKGTICSKETLSGAAMVSDEDNILLNGTKTNICISAKEIPLIGKTGLGNIMVKNNKVVSVTKL